MTNAADYEHLRRAVLHKGNGLTCLKADPSCRRRGICKRRREGELPCAEATKRYG